MSLFQKALSVFSFGSLQIILGKAISLVNFAILVRLLTTEEIGIVGLAGGYIAILSFLLVSPESILIRDFKKISSKINEYISSYLQFILVRNGILFLIAVPLAWYISSIQTDSRLALYFILLVLTTLLNGFTGPFRESFYGLYRQARITFVDVVMNIALLLSMAILFFSRDVITYGFLQVSIAFISVLWWYWNARKHLHFKYQPKWNLSLAFQSLKGFGIWNHLSGSVIRLVYQVDIVVLGFFVSLEALGNYSVALTIANVFFVFPQMVQKILSLSFSQIENKTMLANTFGIGVKYNTLFSLAQFIGFVLVGKWIIAILGPEQPALVELYALYLLAGITLFNIARPWSSMAVARLNPKLFFIELFLPPSVVAVFIYVYAAMNYGVLGVAQANIITFGLMGLWVVVYTHYRLKIRPTLSYISPAEHHFIKKIRDIFIRN